jgi:hypothetical protein
MKEKDCKKTQVFNEKTERCINKNTKQGIELLFNKNNKQILKLYELVDGKIVKKCETPKIRNPITKRCVNKIITKKPINSLKKKVEAIKKAKKALLPFINRVSADIYHRNKYLVLMRRELKNKREGEKGCLKVYKENSDGSYSYRIGNRIILKKRIGSDSVYGIVYLSEFREKSKKLFTFASKVYEYNEQKVLMELKILSFLTNLVRMDKCPHYPIFYGYVLCDNYSRLFNIGYKFDLIDKNTGNIVKVKKETDDSFKKTRSSDKSISQTKKKYPKLIQEDIHSKFITTFNELANGDLWNFFEVYNDNTDYLINALIQQLLSIMFFIYHTRRIHNDTHPGNFLYYKIKAGGYFHYNIYGIDYYLENLGFLWVIWDYDLSKAFVNMSIYSKSLTDFDKIIRCYLPNRINPNINNKIIGYNKDKKIYDNIDLYKFVSRLFIETISKYNDENLNSKFDLDIIKRFMNDLAPSLFKNSSLPKGAKIINKNPYSIHQI